MKLTQYISSLLPGFERSELLSDVRLLSKELVEITIPPFEAAAPIYSKWKFQSKFAQDFAKEFDRNTKTEFRGNYVEVLTGTLVRAQENLDVIERLIEKNFAQDIMRDGLTYMKANILQYLESITFLAKYSRKVLLLTHSSETNMREKRDDRAGKEMTPAERDWLQVNRASFFAVVNIVSGKPKDVETTLAGVPDIIINPDNAQNVLATVGARKLDPYHFGLIPIKMNPIYHIRMAIAEWQVARYNAAIEEKRALEYRLLALKASSDGKKDAKLEEAIEYSEARLAKLNYKLATMEEDYA